MLLPTFIPVPLQLTVFSLFFFDSLSCYINRTKSISPLFSCSRFSGMQINIICGHNQSFGFRFFSSVSSFVSAGVLSFSFV